MANAGGQTWGGTLSYALYDVRGDRIGTVDRTGNTSGRGMADAWGETRPGFTESDAP